MTGTTIACPRCGTNVPERAGVCSSAGKRWTCTACGARFDAEGNPMTEGKQAQDLASKQQVFGARVRECRLRRGMSLRALAELAGVNWTYLSQIERGERNPSLVTILRLSSALEVDPAVLFHGLRLGPPDPAA